MFTCAQDYHAALFAQADEQAEKLATKVAKLEQQLDAAKDAHATAVFEAQALRIHPPQWVEPLEHVQARTR